MPIQLSLAGRDLIKLAEQIHKSSRFDHSVPDRIQSDYENRAPTAHWSEELPPATRNFTAEWGDEINPRQLLIYFPNASVHVKLDLPPEAQQVQSWLADLDFEIAVFATLHDDWADIDPDYHPPTIPTMHYPYGWALALKGEGRKRIVSERWLAYSPAHVERSDDMVFVQFHDPKADSATSLAQAKPGHLAFSSDDEGGLIKEGYLLRHDFNGVYDKATSVFKIAVLGRAVSPREMLDACALRFEGMAPNGKALKNIAYVFLDETEIGEQLHQLWLRGLECWTIREGREVRLDVDYVPPS
jgi:hypothetical protein